MEIDRDSTEPESSRLAARAFVAHTVVVLVVVYEWASDKHVVWVNRSMQPTTASAASWASNGKKREAARREICGSFFLWFLYSGHHNESTT